MLSKENFTLEHIMELRTQNRKDPGLLERVMYAFGLLEAIAQVGMPFIFKGGSRLMLLTPYPRRLSTDIDIIVEPGTDIDFYIMEAAKIFPFKRYEEQTRIGKNKIVKRHFKFIYDSPVQKGEFYILLDVVFSQSPYKYTMLVNIQNDMLVLEKEAIMVTVPTPDCILGDKLTAFAPHTTGIHFGVDKEMEIMKQLYDVATLTDFIEDQESMVDTYYKAVAEETAYRGIESTWEDVLNDTISSAACIIGKGTLQPEEFPLYIKGIRALDSHVLGEKYSGEIAAYQACKVMYLAACILTGHKYQTIEHPENYMDVSIGKSKYKKMAYVKKQKLEAYAYLVEAVHLLEV